MSLHAIVPVKALERAKSRLASTLAPMERQELVLELLGRVLATLARSDVERVWVISPDPLVHTLAAERGATPLMDGAGDLNGALEQARAEVRRSGAGALLVIPADVPLLAPTDVAALKALLVSGADVALAPDRAGQGTNALALRASVTLPFAFGENSAERHLRLAAARGLVARTYHSPALALDVDDPASLARYRALVLSGSCPAPC